MKKFVITFGVALVAASVAFAEGNRVNVRLDGFQEDPLSLSTAGRGRFNARINDAGTRVAYELSYSSLEGDVLQAHIHLGRHSQSGGIMVFLCTNLGNGPAGTQACPAAPATITGVLQAADVIGPAGQGIGAGAFDEFLRSLRTGSAYVNVHSSLYPGGEVRGNITGGGHDHDDDDDDDDD